MFTARKIQIKPRSTSPTNAAMIDSKQPASLALTQIDYKEAAPRSVYLDINAMPSKQLLEEILNIEHCLSILTNTLKKQKKCSRFLLLIVGLTYISQFIWTATTHITRNNKYKANCDAIDHPNVSYGSSCSADNFNFAHSVNNTLCGESLISLCSGFEMTDWYLILFAFWGIFIIGGIGLVVSNAPYSCGKKTLTLEELGLIEKYANKYRIKLPDFSHLHTTKIFYYDHTVKGFEQTLKQLKKDYQKFESRLAFLSGSLDNTESKALNAMFLSHKLPHITQHIFELADIDSKKDNRCAFLNGSHKKNHKQPVFRFFQKLKDTNPDQKETIIKKIFSYSGYAVNSI